LPNGNILWNCLFLMFQMLSLSNQRKCPPFYKLCLGNQTKQTKTYYRIGGRPAGGGSRLSRQKYIIGLFTFTISNAFD
jgi:hypothetical protein